MQNFTFASASSDFDLDLRASEVKPVEQFGHPTPSCYTACGTCPGHTC